jgi:hypothetical protein
MKMNPPAQAMIKVIDEQIEACSPYQLKERIMWGSIKQTVKAVEGWKIILERVDFSILPWKETDAFLARIRNFLEGTCVAMEGKK